VRSTIDWHPRKEHEKEERKDQMSASYGLLQVRRFRQARGNTLKEVFSRATFILLCFFLLSPILDRQINDWAGNREAVRGEAVAEELKDPEIVYKRGVSYATGQGVPQNDVKAVQYFHRAAEQGHAKAQHDLGTCFAKDTGIHRDYAKALHWYRKAAEQGLGQAQYMVGFSLANGRGASRDYTEAAQWLRKAADQGNAYAQYNLGTFYLQGWGVHKNYTKGAKLIRKAAEKGIPEAKKALPILERAGY